MQVTVSREQVAEALAWVRLPAAASIRPVGTVWVHGNFEVTLTDGRRVLLRCLREGPGWDTLLHEQTALALARPALPVVSSFVVLPPEIFGRPAAISSFVAGVDGGEGVADEAVRARVAAHVGEVIGRLAAIRFDAHGSIGTGARFVPRAPTWRGEWSLLVEEAWARASAAGHTLGPLGPAVLARAREGLPRLDGVTGFSLVHRDLHPNNLRLNPDGSLAGVIDWSDALVGDPQVEWASLREAPDAYFDAMHRAAGSPPLDRLPIYDAGRTVQRLGFASLALFDGDGGRMRAVALERARRAALRILGEPVPAMSARDARIRRALEAVRVLPGVRPHLAGAWAGALAGALLGEDWAAWTDRALDALTRDDAARPYGASNPAQVGARVLGALSDVPRGSLSLACAALARQADVALGGTAGERVWAGVAELCEGLIRLEADLDLSATDRRTHAVLGRAACAVLGAPALSGGFPSPDLGFARETLARRDDASTTDGSAPLLAWALEVLG